MTPADYPACAPDTATDACSLNNQMATIELQKSHIVLFPKIMEHKFTIQHSDDDVEYTVTLLHFSNAWHLFLTFGERFASWMCVSRDTVHSKSCSVCTLLGDRREHFKVYARAFVDVLSDLDPNNVTSQELTQAKLLILAIDIKDESAITFNQVLKHMKALVTGC